MLRTSMLLVLSSFVVACGGADEEESVVVFRSLESRQCEGGGRTLAETQALLAGAGATVRSGSCGVDGLGHAGVCGSDDGRIAIFEIPISQSQLALSAGFPSVDGLPYTRAPCQ
jgi:hypothetical protein